MGRRLNISTPTVIQTELVPLDENFVIEANGTLEQWYYDNTAQFAPDRSITPLILTPKISVVDKELHQSWDNEHVIKSVVVWSIMEDSTWVDITSSSASGNYVLSGNNLIVHKNVSYSQGVTIRCRLVYQDPRDNGIYITTQETVLLTCNRDSNVVLPQVAITNPSARSFNPLVDTQTQFDFDAIISNSPDVERQSSDIATYAVDGSGTEEIINDASSVVPILDVRYPDGETQTNQEFMYRRTANGEKTDEVGAAFISKIKGNTVAWNQLAVNNTTNRYYTFTNGSNIVVSDTPSDFNGTDFLLTQRRIVGHKYYGKITSDVTNGYFRLFNYYADSSPINTIRSNSEAKIFTETNNYYAVLGYSGISNGTYKLNVQLIDLTLIYGAGNEPTTVEQFEADYLGWFGKPLSYEPYDAGSLRPVLMNGIKTIGFNQWDEEWVNGYVVKETGNVRENTSTTIASKNLIPVVSDATYYFKGNGYITLYDARQAVVCQVSKNNDTFDVGTNVRYIRFHIDNYGRTYNHDICVNISNQSKNGTYESYEEHLASVPVTSAKGRLLDSNGNVVGNSVFVFPDGLKKVGDVQDEIFVEDGVVKAIKRVGSRDYESGDESDTSVITDGRTTTFYALTTPQTYILDPIQNPFIYKWFGIDANNNEVLAETQPWYVSGQDTNKLKVDAMWGEKINVVLRAMMPTGVLSPSKAYASLSWRIPDVDVTVVSYNGSAVRSDTETMTFGTIVNVKGRSLEDSVKAANLRFKWVYRKNTTTQETVAGWSQGESDQITIQASNLRNTRPQNSSLASALVFPYVYCLGAWTTDSGTETGYSKPTTTKNGVTYYRIID